MCVIFPELYMNRLSVKNDKLYIKNYQLLVISLLNDAPSMSKIDKFYAVSQISSVIIILDFTVYVL